VIGTSRDFLGTDPSCLGACVYPKPPGGNTNRLVRLPVFLGSITAAIGAIQVADAPEDSDGPTPMNWPRRITTMERLERHGSGRLRNPERDPLLYRPVEPGNFRILRGEKADAGELVADGTAVQIHEHAARPLDLGASSIATDSLWARVRSNDFRACVFLSLRRLMR